MSKKNSVSKRKQLHETARNREAELAKKRAEKLKRKKKNMEKNGKLDAEMQSVAGGEGSLVVPMKKKAIRRRINEIKRLTQKGTLTPQDRKELLADIGIDPNDAGKKEVKLMKLSTDKSNKREVDTKMELEQ